MLFEELCRVRMPWFDKVTDSIFAVNNYFLLIRRNLWKTYLRIIGNYLFSLLVFFKCRIKWIFLVDKKSI